MENSTLADWSPPREDASRLSGDLLRSGLGAALLAVSFVALYRHVIFKLVYDWANDDNYSHGFFIVPIALYLAWERRGRLRALERKPNTAGLLIAVASVGALAAGTLGAELFLTRISMLGVLAGAIVFLGGWSHLRVLAFPVAFMTLMVPPPAIIFNQLALPLQLVASRAGEAGLTALHIPVHREGNLIMLAHTTLQVVEACSGIRSIVSLLTLGVVYGYFVDKRVSVRLAIALSTVPIAIFTNALRVAGTGVAAHYYGPEAADGFFHAFSGWVLFIVAFAALPAVRLLVVSSLRIVGLVPSRAEVAVS